MEAVVDFKVAGLDLAVRVLALPITSYNWNKHIAIFSDLEYVLSAPNQTHHTSKQL